MVVGVGMSLFMGGVGVWGVGRDGVSGKKGRGAVFGFGYGIELVVVVE